MIRIIAAAGCVCTTVSAAFAADFAVCREADRLVVTAGDEPVAAFVFADPAVGRPAIRDLAAPGGTVVTRPCPPRQGVDADDHATMHPGLWLGFSDLSGADPWRHKTAVRFAGFDGEPAVVDGVARFTAKIEYLAAAADTPDAPVACRERSSVSIRDRVIDGFPVRILLWEAELAPGGNKPLIFGDTEEMGFGLRVATPLSPARGGRYVASHGGVNEKGIFGRAAAWVDASGTIDGRRVGAAVIDLASNPREPFFHARDYGLVLANAFGRQAYGAKDPPPPITVEPGKSLRLEYAILLHGDVPDDRLAGLVTRVRDEIEKAPAAKQEARHARPLAQQYTVVHRTPDDPDPARSICIGSPDLLRLPDGRLLASMEYWLKRPTSGDEGGVEYPRHCKIKASDDGGATWKQIATTGITWGSLFLHEGAVYLLGNDPLSRDIRIVRSTDGGLTWSQPAVLFADSRYHGAATPVVRRGGFLYRAFEDTDRGYASCVIAGDASADLLNPASWRMSNKVGPPRDTPGLVDAAEHRDRPVTPNGFLEGNVVDVAGRLRVLLRTRIDDQRSAGLAAACHLEDDGMALQYRFGRFFAMPGGQNKFKVIHDEPSGLFWTCGSAVPDDLASEQDLAAAGVAGTAGNTRRMLLLLYSRDATNWFQAGCVALSHNPLESFHYASPAIDGDDLVVLARSTLGAADGFAGSTWDRAPPATGKAKLPYNNHDSNAITFHRVKDFRSLALDLRPDFSATAVVPAFTGSPAPAIAAGDPEAAPTRHDVVVIGASPAGIAAAVAARREGRSVVLVEELSRVGGMYTAGGMGLADCFFMDRRMIDGLFEEIHGRIDAHYRRQGIAYRPANHRDRFPKDQGRWYHEPKVAEKIFQELLAEAGVEVITGQPVVAVRKPGSRIEAVELADGRLLAGRGFIDATYTGDLMALAKVKHVVGREGRAAYGESLAGKQVIHGQRKVWKVDPRDAAGRLLPTVNTDDPGPTEEGDHKIQNYNFRLTLTDDPANRVTIPPPRRYDPARYELLRRYLLAHPDDARIKEPYPLPNRKFDWNDAQSVAFSHAIPGGSWDYPAADLPTRRRIEDDHREFTLGMLHFIRTDPSVPKRIRDSFARFGLPKDEHVDTGHFPPMIYIREARRMVGEHVLTQHDIDREPRKPDSIGLGLAPITVHNVQRVALDDGYYHEGSAHTPYEPHGAAYQIPYRALLPTRAECDNLLVPVCLSASHVALGSIRVEPTWIMLGQSAGVAAALAAAERIACHDVPYARLRARLLAGGQVLDILSEPEPKQPAEPKP